MGTPEKIDHTRYYEILGVARDATPEEVRDAWLNAARTNHPDKGGDAEKFIEVERAYKFLSDPMTRWIYDEYGEDVVEEIIAKRLDPVDVIWGLMTNGSGRDRRLRRGKDVTHPLKVTREDLDSGTTKLFRLLRNVICSKCKGKGSKSGATVTCAGCEGLGVKVSKGRMPHPCSECKATGEAAGHNDRCPKCKGEKVVLEKKVLEVHVEKGMQEGHEITFPGEANESPNVITGDVVFELQLLSNED